MGVIKRFAGRFISWFRDKRWACWERSLKHVHYGVRRKKRKQQIIISLTSYEPRLEYLSLPLRSLLKQTMKPDRILVWLSCDFNLLPQEVRDLEKCGVEFRKAPFDAKSHKKYLFTMKEYPSDYIVTVDDDIIYGPDLVTSLWKTHKKHPDSVVARRVHRIRFSKEGQIEPYNLWDYECRDLASSSFLLCPTGSGGILYPPNSLGADALNEGLIYETDAISADDLWLKYMALIKGTKTVWAPNFDLPLHSVAGSQEAALFADNVINGGNDRVIQALERRYRTAVERSTKNAFYPCESSILISIVIPIYNAEKTLPRCLRSLEVQYSDDCEIIMVNDGSTDGSLAIAKDFATKLCNSYVVDKKNEGSNSAYNLGFSLARGRYLLSLDDDDELGPATLDSVREDIQTMAPDIIQFNVTDINEDNGSSLSMANTPMYFASPQEIRNGFGLLDNQIRTHSGKALRKDLISGLLFSGNPHGADTRFFIKVLARTTTMVIDPRACWLHHFRSWSQSNKPHDIKFHLSWMENLRQDLDFFRSERFPISAPFIGIDILFSHYCFYCQQSFENNSFDKRKARLFGRVFWRRRSLFDKALRKEIFKRYFFPRVVARRNARR